VWDEATVQDISQGFRQSVHILKKSSSCLAAYIPPTRIQVLDADTIQVVQYEIDGQTIAQIGHAVKSRDGDNLAILSKRLSVSLNALFLDCLHFAIQSTTYDETDMPRAITFTGHPVMRHPKKGEAVMPEIIAGNGMTNIMFGTLVRNQSTEWKEPRVWISDVTGLALIDKTVVDKGIFQLLQNGLIEGGISPSILDPNVQQMCFELEKHIQ
jgi:hypothetical protein